jgi:hypothetical protein
MVDDLPERRQLDLAVQDFAEHADAVASHDGHEVGAGRRVVEALQPETFALAHIRSIAGYRPCVCDGFAPIAPQPAPFRSG